MVRLVSLETIAPWRYQRQRHAPLSEKYWMENELKRLQEKERRRDQEERERQFNETREMKKKIWEIQLALLQRNNQPLQ